MYYNRSLTVLLALSIGIVIVSGLSLGFIVKAKGNQEAESVLEKKRVEVIADNHNITVDTHAETVGDVLKQLNIRTGDHDMVEPSIGTKLSSQMQIRVTRISEFEDEVYEDIPFVTVTYYDPDLLAGNQMVVQEGKPGKEAIRRSYRVENGITVTNEVKGRKVVSPYIPRVVAVGTAEPKPIIASYDPNHSEDGQLEDQPSNNSQVPKPKVITIETRPVNYSFKLDDIQLTAYTAGFESTGKDPGDHGYGITASGSTVTEGRTIAVDPEVIPLGWWVYIQGIGYRKAEDTGSSIKGKIIDLYMEDLSKAKKFGRKHGYTVYVIGPEKPQ